MHPFSPGRGLWALLCEYCHAAHEIGFGLGRGQKYATATRRKVD
jgi:hypothetical protein